MSAVARNSARQLRRFETVEDLGTHLSLPIGTLTAKMRTSVLIHRSSVAIRKVPSRGLWNYTVCLGKHFANVRLANILLNLVLDICALFGENGARLRSGVSDVELRSFSRALIFDDDVAFGIQGTHSGCRPAIGESRTHPERLRLFESDALSVGHRTVPDPLIIHTGYGWFRFAVFCHVTHAVMSVLAFEQFHRNVG